MATLSLLLGLFFLFAPSVEAWDFDQKSELQPTWLYREVPQMGLSSRSHSVDLLLRANTQLRFSEGNLQFEIKPELSGYQGDSSSTADAMTDPYYLSLKSPNRFLNWRRSLSRDKEWLLDIDKVNLLYGKDDFEFAFGRKPVSLGVLKVFSVWNKFSKPLPMTVGPATIFSSDIISARYQDQETTWIATQIFGSTQADSVSLAQRVQYNSNYEWHFLLAQWWEHSVMGLAFAKDYWGATWRVETLFIKAKDSLEKDEVQAGLGFEVAINDKLSVLSEHLFQSRAAQKTSDYKFPSSTPFSAPFHSMLASSYNYTQLQYKMTSLLSSNLSLLSNWVDGSKYILFKSQYSYSDRMDAFVEVNIPSGSEGSEFARKSIVFANGFYRGAPSQLSLGLKYVF